MTSHPRSQTWVLRLRLGQPEWVDTGLRSPSLRMTDVKRDRFSSSWKALEEFQRSSRRLLPEQPKQSQIWSHLRPERRYPEQFLLILTALSKGSKRSRRPPGAVMIASRHGAAKANEPVARRSTATSEEATVAGTAAATNGRYEGYRPPADYFSNLTPPMTGRGTHLPWAALMMPSTISTRKTR